MKMHIRKIFYIGVITVSILCSSSCFAQSSKENKATSFQYMKKLNQVFDYVQQNYVDELDPNIKLIVIDEAYSMPYKLKKDIEKFGIKIIACGDQGQLPPVNDSPAYLARGKIYHLTRCMRQLGREDINYIATRAGKGLPLINGYYGNSIVIDKNDLTMDMLLWADAIICTRNDTRDKINNKIRKTLGYTTDIPMMGEKVVCRSNNWLECIYLDNGSQINPVNGLICRVLSQPDVSSFDGKLFSMTFYPELAPQAIFTESRCNYLH